MKKALSERLQVLVESVAFRSVVMCVIVLAGLLVGFETYPQVVARYGKLLNHIDSFIAVFFIIEIVLRLAAYGKRPWRFFLDAWNVFDFVIVAFCVLPLQLEYVAVLRLVRVLRVLRLVSALPGLQMLVGALLKSVPSIGYISILLFLNFYIYACLGSFLFAKNDARNFGTLDRSMLSLFQVVTLEGWVDIMDRQRFGVDQNGEVHKAPEDPFSKASPDAYPVLAPLYFISFILFGTMIILNLFIGVILNGMAEMKDEHDMQRLMNLQQEQRMELEDEIALITKELNLISSKLAQVRSRIGRSRKKIDNI